MSATETRNTDSTDRPNAGIGDVKLEVVVIPVSDVDRAKAFYSSLGWRLDADITGGEEFRLVQFTPSGSGCSIHFGTNVTTAPPGSAQGLHLIVSDIEAARAALVAAGVGVTDVYHCASGAACRYREAGGVFERVNGPAPAHATYSSFASFSDPDGNGWLFQEVTTRLPGRVDSAATTFSSVADLADAMRRASTAHGEHEARIGAADPNWPDWYAEYMVREQSGAELPT